MAFSRKRRRGKRNWRWSRGAAGALARKFIVRHLQRPRDQRGREEAACVPRPSSSQPAAGEQASGQRAPWIERGQPHEELGPAAALFQAVSTKKTTKAARTLSRFVQSAFLRIVCWLYGPRLILHILLSMAGNRGQPQATRPGIDPSDPSTPESIDLGSEWYQEKTPGAPASAHAALA